MSSTTEFYELGGIPIDRVAWRVVQPGYHWETSSKVEILTFDTPPRPPTSKGTYGPGQMRPKDYVGTEFGRLTVWHYWRHKDKVVAGKGHVWDRLGPTSPLDVRRIRSKLRPQKASGASEHEWLCRCVCGLFCVRTSASIKAVLQPKYCSIDSPDMCILELMMCSHCAALEKLRRPLIEAKPRRPRPQARIEGAK